MVLGFVLGSILASSAAFQRYAYQVWITALVLDTDTFMNNNVLTRRGITQKQRWKQRGLILSSF